MEEATHSLGALTAPAAVQARPVTSERRGGGEEDKKNEYDTWGPQAQ